MRLAERLMHAGACGALLGALAAAPGCGRKQAAQPAAAAGRVERVFEGGPLRLTVRAPSDTINAAQRLHLSVAASVASGYAPSEWKVGEKLGAFTVASRRTSPPTLGPDGRTVTTTDLELEPFLPGDYEIPPIEIKATPVTKDSGEPVSVTTEPLAVHVTSVLADAEDAKDVAGLKDIAPAPASRMWMWWAGGGVAAAAVVTAGLVLAARRRGRIVRAAVPPPPPHEVALRRLRALRQSALIERSEHKAFFNELSDILRRYIEDRFGMRAPERTTEEFLREAATASFFRVEDVLVLRRFLSLCDLVKFAEARPTVDEARESLDIAQDFVERTRPTPPGAGVEAAGEGADEHAAVGAA